MALLEVLALELGPAISKAILKFWLKDNSIAADISSDLMDLIKPRISGVLSQQKANRQFTAIGERVIESLDPVFRIEGTGLNENSKEAVTHKIVFILNNSKIESSLLATQNLDPANLAKYLLELHRDVRRDLVAKEVAFFDRILSDVCQNIIDIASELPAFSELTFSEILKRETLLLEKAELIISEVRRIQTSSSKNAAAAQFESEYRRAIIRNLDEVELFGVDVSKASKRHRLSVSYVVLDVKKKMRHNALNDAESNVHKVIKECPHIFLRGDAGSGKTTLLKWIAVRAAVRKFPEDLKEFDNYVPFFIRLRNFADKKLPAPEDFPALASPAITNMMPPKWVHETLIWGKAFVLIDGLDEVPHTQREEVRIWLNDLMGHFPKVRYILSSRPSVMSEKLDLIEEFEEAFLQPMADWAIDLFINKWHAAVQEMVDEPSEKQEIPALAENLRKVIRDNQRIFSLAKTPLLCALICALHRDRKKQLPKDRIELYSACTEMLVERREKEKRSINYKDEYPQLSYRQKFAILKECAYWFMKNNWSSVEASRLDQHISNKLQNMENIDHNVTGSKIRKYFVERSGILREPSSGYIDFTHRTFQEFLAAHEVLDEDDMGLLLDKALDNQWSEVIVLAAGLASQKVCDQFLSNLIDLGQKAENAGVEENKYQYYLLTASCLETVVAISPKVKQVIDEALSTLNPPRDQSEARQWSFAGEIVIPYLMKNATKRQKAAAECVRALIWNKNKAAAMQVLPHLANDDRTDILKIIVDGWSLFDRDDYAKNVLSKNPKFRNYINDIPDLQGLRYITYLSKLKIKEGLLTGLDTIEIEDLNLNYISLVRCNKLVDVDALSYMKNTKVLILAGCLAIKNIVPLRKLINLQILDLSLCENISDLSPIAEMKNLKVLSLVGCGRIRDLSPLFSLKDLCALNLTGCDKVSFDQIEKIREQHDDILIYNVVPKIIHTSRRNNASTVGTYSLGNSRPSEPHYRPVHQYVSPEVSNPQIPTPRISSQSIPMSHYMNDFAVKCRDVLSKVNVSKQIFLDAIEYSQDLQSAFELYKPGYSEDYQTAKPGFTSGEILPPAV